MSSPVTVYAVRLRSEPEVLWSDIRQGCATPHYSLTPSRERAENELALWKDHQTLDDTAAVVRFTLTEQGEVD